MNESSKANRRNAPTNSVHVAVSIGAVALLAVVIAGFLSMTPRPDCLDPQEAHVLQLIAVVRPNGECIYRPAG